MGGSLSRGFGLPCVLILRSGNRKPLGENDLGFGNGAVEEFRQAFREPLRGNLRATFDTAQIAGIDSYSRRHMLQRQAAAQACVFQGGERGHRCGFSVIAQILRDPQKYSKQILRFALCVERRISRRMGRMNVGTEMSVGTEIRKRRKALGWTLEELAGRVDSDTGNLSRIERGRQGANDELLRKIARALGCGIADLYAATEGVSNVVAAPVGMRRIPLISYVQAGAWTEAVDPYAVGHAFDWMLTDLDLSSSAFALEVKGLSMYNPTSEDSFNEGDRVIIDPNVCPKPGDFVVAKNGENEATFKKYRPRGMNAAGEQVFELVPLNPDYESLRSDITHIRIIGTMVEHRRYRKRR